MISWIDPKKWDWTPPPPHLKSKKLFQNHPLISNSFSRRISPPNSRKNPFWNQTRTFLRIHYVTIYHAKIQHFQILCRPSPVIPHFWNVCNVVLSIYIGLYLYYQFIYLIHAQGRSLLTMHSCRNLHEFVGVIWNVYVGMNIEKLFFKIRYIENEFFGSKKNIMKNHEFSRISEGTPPTPPPT